MGRLAPLLVGISLVEGGGNELGFYLVSDGGLACTACTSASRASFWLPGVPSRGHHLSDAIVILSSMNVIAGELDAWFC
jgi:NADH-quinone oxidoreductase subunit D